MKGQQNKSERKVNETKAKLMKGQQNESEQKVNETKANERSTKRK